jgi:hypothetical protein
MAGSLDKAERKKQENADLSYLTSENSIMLEKTEFLFYYLKLRFTVAIGFHKTANPLYLEWRWKNWNAIRSTTERKRNHKLERNK